MTFEEHCQETECFSGQGIHNARVDWDAGAEAERERWAAVCDKLAAYVLEFFPEDTDGWASGMCRRIADRLRKNQDAVPLAEERP